jgi:glycosyltransferase involved in cell wall biosynthesis
MIIFKRCENRWKMKVLMIGSHLKVNGGITRVVKNYIQAGIGDKLTFKYFPTYLGSNHIINLLYFFIRFVTLYFILFIIQKKYDVAHIHMSYKGSFLRKKYIINLLDLKGIPIILHMHGSQFKDFYNNSTLNKQRDIRNILDKSSAILALGEQWKTFYKTITKTEVVSLDNAVFPKSDLILKQQNEEKIFITTMGVLSKRKGSYDILKIASNLQGKIDQKYKFLLGGDGEVEQIKGKIKDLGLNNVIVTGWISNDEEIQKIYKKSIIYMLPSYNEGMPMSILEAMSYGVPIISTNVGSIPSVVGEKNGFIVEAGDLITIEEKIVELLNDKSKMLEMSVENIKTINNKYNINKSLDSLIKLYRKLGRGLS